MSETIESENTTTENNVNVEQDRLSIKRVFNGTIEHLFSCFTQPELLRQWHAPGALTTPNVEVDFRVNGRYRITMKNPEGQIFTATGEYKEIESPNKLVYSWSWEGKDSPATLVTVLFKAIGEKTEVELIHEGFQVSDDAQHHSQGWNGIFINLGNFLQQ